MNYAEFLENLNTAGFKVIGRSYAFNNFNGWEVAFIRMGGKFQFPGKICFVICARPENAKGLEGEIVENSRNPHDYPFKLVLDEINKPLKYQSKLLKYQTEYLETEADWENIHQLLSKVLPEKLNDLGIAGFEAELRAIKHPGYIEKIWLGQDVEV